MLGLAGYILDRLDEDRPASDGKRINAIRNARQELKRLTGVDHGYDLKAWADYLSAGDFGYDHPYAWRGVRTAIENAAQDLDRGRLLDVLAAKEQRRSSD